MNFEKLYEEFLKNSGDFFKKYAVFDVVPKSDKIYKEKIFGLLGQAIAHRDNNKLVFALQIAFRDGIDSDYTPYINQLLRESWHQEHEELAGIIYLDGIKDDIFSDAIYRIAVEPDVYRKNDFELESCLRKCVHALKTINSEKSNNYIDKLKSINNENIQSVLEMYNE